MCSFTNRMSMVYRVSATFKGKVQGVYFRQYTRRWAEMLSLSGYVKNMPDGTVLAVFEGPESEVTSVDIKVEEPEGLEGFEIVS